MIKRFLFFVLILTGSLFSQGTYYDLINTASPTFVTDLKARVRSPYTKVSYDLFDETNVANFASIDNQNGTRSVFCVYSNYEYTYSGTFTWSVFSREHTYCHSWMPTYTSTSGDEYADQHHLFPTHQDNANGRRSNHPLGICATIDYQFGDGKLGKNTAGETVYEPRDGHKGDAARAILYMMVRYDDVNGKNWDFDYLNARLPAINEGQQSLAILLQWHMQDPPDAWELARNNYVQSIQGNRNPFVDHPEYVSFINFNDMSYASSSTLADEPTNHVTSFSILTTQSNYLSVNWVDALPGTQAPQGYLLIAKNSNTIVAPSDGVTPTSDNDLSDGSAAVFINYSAADSIGFSGLTAGTTYYFAIYPYNGTGTQINYKTSAVVPAVSGATSGSSGSSYMSDLLISEYVEGTSNNKYIEILNYTGADVNMSQYSLAIYANGSATATGTIALSSFTLSHGNVYVVKNPSATVWTGTANDSSGSLNFNGDDVVALKKGAVLIDVIGKIGERPATGYWGTGSITTLDHTLRRKNTITAGDADGSNAFDPSVEWDSYAADVVTDLGNYAPLPVELKSFNYIIKESKVVLNWETATELNNFGFEIEKMTENGWQNIGFVQGMGNSNSPKFYTFEDKYPVFPAQYRLKQIDADGSFIYSKSVEVGNVLSKFSIDQNYPNPFNPSTMVNYSLPYKSRVKIDIFNSLGELVKTAEDSYKDAGNYMLSINLEGSPSGIYYLKFQGDSFSETKKLMLLK